MSIGNWEKLSDNAVELSAPAPKLSDPAPKSIDPAPKSIGSTPKLSDPASLATPKLHFLDKVRYNQK